MYTTTITDTLQRLRRDTDNQKAALTEKEIKKLNELNQKFIQYESAIKNKVIELLTFANHQINDTNDWINHCDGCSVEIFFHLIDNDPCIDDEDDNILVILESHFHTIDRIYCLNDGYDHNTVQSIIKGKHCCILHSLYDHADLSFKEILRIGKISVNFDLRILYEEE